MNRPTTMSRVRLKDIWEQVMTMGALSGIFRTCLGGTRFRSNKALSGHHLALVVQQSCFLIVTNDLQESTLSPQALLAGYKGQTDEEWGF